jgi:hypothetical protein
MEGSGSEYAFQLIAGLPPSREDGDRRWSLD